MSAANKTQVREAVEKALRSDPVAIKTTGELSDGHVLSAPVPDGIMDIVRAVTEPRIGMEFIHASWLDENYEPLRCRVTAIRRGGVYWRGVYADGRLGGSTFCDLAEFPKRIKSIVEK